MQRAGFLEALRQCLQARRSTAADPDDVRVGLILMAMVVATSGDLLITVRR
ncbi:MAG: hypothetical protein AAF533_03830 [Acidobacteriota bacterium]